VSTTIPSPEREGGKEGGKEGGREGERAPAYETRAGERGCGGGGGGKWMSWYRVGWASRSALFFFGDKKENKRAHIPVGHHESMSDREYWDSIRSEYWVLLLGLGFRV